MRRLVFVLGLMAVLFFAACGGGAAAMATPTKPPAAAVVTPGPTQPPATPAGARGEITLISNRDLGPIIPWLGTSHPALPHAVWQHFADRGLEYQVIPNVAESWSLSPDRKKLTVKLRKDIKFHNGDKFTSKDVVWAWENIYGGCGPNHNYDGRWASAGAGCKGQPYSVPRIVSPEGWQAVDEYTVTLSFNTPDPIFDQSILADLTATPYLVVPSDYIQRVGRKAYEDRPIASGSYRFVEGRPGERFVLEAADDYKGGLPKPEVKRVVIRAIVEHETRLAELLTGQADFAEGILPTQVPQVRARSGMRIVDPKVCQMIALYFNTLDKTIPGTDTPNPFRDLQVRRAFAAAIDTKPIIEGITQGLGKPVSGPWPQCIPGWDERNIKAYEYNPTLARQLLQQAKFPLGSYEVPFHAYILSPLAPEATEAAANYLTQVGVKTKFVNQEVGSWVRMMQGRTWDGLTMVRGRFTERDASFVLEQRLSKTATLGKSDIPEVDAGLEAARNIFDPKAREEHWRNMYHFIHDNVYSITLYQDFLMHGVGPRIDFPFPDGEILVRFIEYIKWRPGY